MKKFLVLLSLLFSSFTYADTINLHWLNEDGTTYQNSTCVVDSDLILPATPPTKYGYTFTGWKMLPYTPLEYIESTGLEFINTGVVFNGPNAEVILKFEPMNVNHSGQYAYSGTEWCFTVSNIKPGKMFFFHGNINASTVPALHIDISTNTEYVLDMIQQNDILKYIVNGVETSISATINYPPSSPYILFGTYYGDTAGRERSAMKLYYAKIYDNGVLVRDMFPALDENGTPCMYDNVTKQFFYNQGAGVFIAGPVL